MEEIFGVAESLPLECLGASWVASILGVAVSVYIINSVITDIFTVGLFIAITALIGARFGAFTGKFFA